MKSGSIWTSRHGISPHRPHVSDDASSRADPDSGHRRRQTRLGPADDDPAWLQRLPGDNKLVRTLSWDGRIAQDVRLMLPLRWTWAAHESSDTAFLPRLQYRNYTRLPRGFAAHVIVTGETDPVRRPDLSYDPPATTGSGFVSTALLHYRVSRSASHRHQRSGSTAVYQVPGAGGLLRHPDPAQNVLGQQAPPSDALSLWARRQ